MSWRSTWWRIRTSNLLPMSESLCVIVPSRGRPAGVAALRRAWTETDAVAHLTVAVDRDDPECGAYLAVGGDIVLGARLRMAGTLNKVALERATRYRYIGFMGDDHRPRSAGWDDEIRETLQEMGTGIVYGDDLLQGKKLPTAVFMTSNIIRALGYMALPGLIHLYLDNFWLDLGTTADVLRYLPDVVIEHMHPTNGKAPMDAGYAEVNDPAMYAADAETYVTYRRSRRFGADVDKVRALANVRVPLSLDISERWYPR